ncbi:hypothetical protein ACFY00_30140 [Kitasatospora sp. NPDC001540]|uniref:hypothetical protein n=1 Tax=Kitasatospora sp. NPDC001540 TaxID=3364014 RepID=UPI003692394F
MVYALLRPSAPRAAPSTQPAPTAPTVPAQASAPLAFRDHDRPAADDRVPHALAAFAPPGAVWEPTPGLPLTTNAESCTAWIDRGSGTLCARVLRPRVPLG